MKHLCLVAATLTLSTTPLVAQMALDPACVLDPGAQTSCTHAIACIGGDTLFVGGTTGWDSGTLTGDLSTGASCTGSWDSAENLVRFECEDGQSGQVVYWSQDPETGTALGSGATLAGRPIEAWSGNNIADYVLRETGEVTLQCGVTDVPLS
jgi:predicted RecA/RadA family phage recombinase